MDEDEDDVFKKALQCWPSSHGQIKQTDRGLETAGRPPVPLNVMLRCRAHEESRRFLYGNAGLLLLTPPTHSQRADVVLRGNLQAMDPPAQSVETVIGQKLQLIGDQFYQEHMMHQRNRRNRQPLWWNVALAFYTLLFERHAAGRENRR